MTAARARGGGQAAPVPLLLAALTVVSLAACGPPAPYVRYHGRDFGRTPKPVDEMEVLRTGPPPTRFQDLGTVVVTCPSELAPGFFGTSSSYGGCGYGWAVRQACVRAAAAGADGIHSIESSADSAGKMVSLRASVFVRLPELVVSPAPPEKKPEPNVKERLKQLDELKSENLITPEEYQKKRAEILNDI